MKKRKALTRAFLGIVMIDFIKNTRPPIFRITDEVKLYAIGIVLLLTFTSGGFYFALKMNNPTAIFWGVSIGFFFASWLTYASEIIKDRYQFLDRLNQIEKVA